MTRKPAIGSRAERSLMRLPGQPPADTSLGKHVRAFDTSAQGSETARGARGAWPAVRDCTATRWSGRPVRVRHRTRASNTAHVKVSWLFGSSHVSLVWLVLAAAILGWLLGLVTNAALPPPHSRTRAAARGPELDRSAGARQSAATATTLYDTGGFFMETST